MCGFNGEHTKHNDDRESDSDTGASNGSAYSSAYSNTCANSYAVVVRDNALHVKLSSGHGFRDGSPGIHNRNPASPKRDNR
jgi:hypothetical protein